MRADNAQMSPPAGAPLGAAGPADPPLNLVGQKVALGPLERRYLPLYQRWINDFEAVRGLQLIRPMPNEAEEAWYTRAVQATDRIDFTIFVRDGLRPIGTAGLFDLDPQNGKAEFGILIGERDCWGRGYGTEATRLVLDYGFNILSLHNILLRVYAFNERAIRAYRRAGFKEMGSRREARRLAGQRFDEIYMDCLATEFASPAVQAWYPPAK
jgi:RimJ/RimL family protein N-acetyltransferase